MKMDTVRNMNTTNQMQTNQTHCDTDWTLICLLHPTALGRKHTKTKQTAKGKY